MKWIKIIALVGMILAVVMGNLSRNTGNEPDWNDKARLVASQYDPAENSEKTVSIPESQLFSLIMAYRLDYGGLTMTQGFLMLFSGIVFVLFGIVFLLARKTTRPPLPPTAVKSERC